MTAKVSVCIPASIIIPTLNRSLALYETLTSLFNCTNIPDEVIIVDQSDDSTTENMLKSFSQYNIIYKKIEKKTLTGARNIGIKLATNDILIFCDDDVTFFEDTIGNVYEYMAREDIALIGAHDKKFMKSVGFLHWLLAGMFDFRALTKYKVAAATPVLTGIFPGKIKHKNPAEWAMGFCFSVKKHLLQKWNVFFDETLEKYAYGEDFDFSCRYCMAAKKVGLDTFYSNKVYVTHRESLEYRFPNENVLFWYTANRLYFADKYKKSKITHILIYIHSLAMAVRWGVKERNALLRLKVLWRVFKSRQSMGEK